LRLHQLYANISEDNLASIHLFKSNGFELIGTKKDWRRTLDGWKNELMFQKIL
jgi:diamine N-acetyltransferase